MGYVAIGVNIKNVAVTQYTEYDFNSMAVFSGVPLAANSSGIYRLDSGDTFNGVDVEAYFILPYTDFGTSFLKKIRRVNVGYEANGDLRLTMLYDEGAANLSTTMTLSGLGMRKHEGVVYFRRDMLGTYLTLKVENLEGCDFSVDTIEAIVVPVNRKTLVRS